MNHETIDQISKRLVKRFEGRDESAANKRNEEWSKKVEKALAERKQLAPNTIGIYV